jgi:hypothetical protein
MVLAAAVDYIKMITQECEMLRKENNEINEYRKENSGSKDRQESKRRRVDPASGSAVS